MSTAFFGFDIAKSGLFASQRALEVTNHNVSNANTEGFSRQLIEQRASKPLALYDGTGMLGTGTDIISVERARDDYLDIKFRNKSAELGEWEAKSSALESIEYIFNENSTVNFSNVTEDFYDALQELSKDPSSDQNRTILKQVGITFCKYFNTLSNEIYSKRVETDKEIGLAVQEINAYAQQISILNRQIVTQEMDGKNYANDLRDRRDLLIDKLSGLIDIEVNEVVVGEKLNGEADKRLQIRLNGLYLVNDNKANLLEFYDYDPALLPADKEYLNGFHGIRWEGSGNEFIPEGGMLKGLFDSRDGNGQNGEYKGVQYYLDKLDEFVRCFAKAFNEGITKSGTKSYLGYSEGVNEDGETGIRFFSYSDVSSEELILNGYESITAKNFSLSEEIMEDAGCIATSTTGVEGDNDVIEALIGTRSDESMFAEGEPEDYITALISNLGVDTEFAMGLSSSQKVFVQQIDNQRMSVSGVSLDEEMINIVKYQQAYNAAAKMINVFDEVLDMTINGLGA